MIRLFQNQNIFYKMKTIQIPSKFETHRQRILQDSLENINTCDSKPLDTGSASALQNYFHE